MMLKNLSVLSRLDWAIAISILMTLAATGLTAAPQAARATTPTTAIVPALA